MLIDALLLDSLTERAKTYPRLRVAYDLRTTPQDNSQRILNAMEPRTVLPIHRHQTTTESVAVLRGSVRQNFYNEERNIVESFIVKSGSFLNFFQVPVGVWHNTECLESGTIIFEAKDGKYEPLSQSDIMIL